MRPPKITVVIPNWNGKRYLEVCLPSIHRQTYRPIGITIVDNGSNDGSLAWCRDRQPDIHFIRFEDNRGFGAAVNAGIKDSRSELICLLNNDTELDERFFEKIVDAFNSRPEIDFIAPKMICFHDRSLLDGAGDGFLRGGIGYRIGTMEADGGAFDSPRPIFAACAGAAVYRRTFFDAVGYFDEDFFAYLEDVDLHLRAARRAMKGLYLPQARVYHIGSASSGGRVNPFIVRQTTRNQINLLVKNFTFLDMIPALAAILFHHLLWVAVVLKHGEILAYLSGLLQGLGSIRKMRHKRLGSFPDISVTGHNRYEDIVKKAEDEVICAIIRRRKKMNRPHWMFEAYRRVRGGGHRLSPLASPFGMLRDE